MTEKILKLTLKKSATLFFVAIFVFSTGFNLSMPFVAYGDDSTETTPVELKAVEEVKSDKTIEEVASDVQEEVTEESEVVEAETPTDVVDTTEIGTVLGDEISDPENNIRDNTGEEIGLDDESVDPTEPLLPIRIKVIEDEVQVCVDGNDDTWSLSYYNSVEGQAILNIDLDDDTYQGHCESSQEICTADITIRSGEDGANEYISDGDEYQQDAGETDSLPDAVATWTHDLWTSITGSTWMWETAEVQNPTQEETRRITRKFLVPGSNINVTEATLNVAADNTYEISFNSNLNVFADNAEDNFSSVDTYSSPLLASYVNEGWNWLTFEVTNLAQTNGTAQSNPAGVIYDLNIKYSYDCPVDYGYLTVNKVVEGGENTFKDFPLFVDEELVTSGAEKEFPVGVHYVSEDNSIPGYTATFSGACTDQDQDGIAEVTIVEGNKHVCTITNTFQDEEEVGYCGDTIVNQNWEACDGGESCTQTCQFEDQCTDKVFARVVVENVINDSEETGDVTDNIYLGGNENPQIVPTGAWFAIYDGTNFLIDTRTTGSAYFDVPGIAVQRTHNGGVSKILTGIYGHDLGGDTLEHVDGYIEFSNNISPVSVINGPGSLGLENGFDSTGFGGIDHNNDEVSIDGYLAKFSLGTMSKGDAFYTQLSEPVSCDGGYCGDRVINQEWEACELGDENCTETCQFDDQCTDKAFAKITIENVIKDPAEDGNITSDIYLGGASDPEIIPSGTWFMVYDGANYITDIRTGAEGSSYFNVPGVGVQRLVTGGIPKILTGIYGHDLGGDTLEHVDGKIEFSGNTGAIALIDGPGSLHLENGIDGTGFGGVDHNNDEIRLNGDVAEFSLGTMSKGDAFFTSYSVPELCDDGGGEENTCDANVNLMQNGSFETDEVGSSWNIFDSGTIAWLANWLNPIGAPAIAKIELQGNGLNGWLASDGDQWAELDSDFGYANNESGATEIYQNIPTIVGNTYTVSYAFSPRPGVTANTLVASAEEIQQDTVSADGSALLNTNWEDRSYTFVATDTSTKFAFKNTDTSDSLGTFLDNVSVVCTDDGIGGEEGTEEICGNGIDDDGDQLIDEDCSTGGGSNDDGSNNNSGSSSSSSSSSSSTPTGTVLGDNTGTGDGEVLGESLASTGTENVSYIVLSALILAFLVATKRKQSII